MGTPSRRDRNAAERRINGVGDGQRKWFLLLWHKMIRKEFQMKKDPLRPRAVPWYEMGLLSLDVITIQQL